MAILVFGELKDGKLRKQNFEAASYAYDLGQATGQEVHAVVVGPADTGDLQTLGKYGVSKIHHVDHADLKEFNEAPYASAVAAVAQQIGARFVVLSQTFNGKALTPRLAIKLGMPSLTGVVELAQVEGDSVTVKRSAFTTKAIQTLKANKASAVISVKANAYKMEEHAADGAVESFAFTPDEKDFTARVRDVARSGDKLSVTEADTIVSAGRGLKGPEHWNMVEELADLLGAATACSKPVADIEWRPHHEHVGQTGIQIAPNVYIAIGISGAIQHLAGVNASKTIIVINKDQEAPFFKAADYGVVGDAFDVVPSLINAIKDYKSQN